MGTGLIVAFVVAVWAAYFVPLVLRRYDEVTKTSSLEHLSPLSRVIHRRTTEEPEAEIGEPKSTVVEPVETTEPAVEKRPQTRSARIAAQRRRRTLLTLLFLTAVVGALAFAKVVPVYSVAAPVGLVVAWLVACRVQVRSERPTQAEKERKVDFADEETVIVSGQIEDVDPGRKNVMLEVELEADALDEQLVIAVPSVATTGEAVWDPLPVTLPTYVTKPRAGRTVRTIDFAQPGAWTSGHVEGEDVELPGASANDEQAPRRAAGE
ncbi:divisome protein SepX/GlpR [Aeromicrobium terrae]|uniref:Uncharacterized protein n=1 Tax=Aeromicrobium terrae TaxID=2498846 RepID=A0A5C8NLM2_9ACTN|nr:hypothetical protein [Aeromicrobium terrae]TXL62148.1 hypothetical protein FHP06_05440 [Aeromicrobium terrae]